MKHILTKHDFPTDTLRNAVDDMADASPVALAAFNAEFGIPNDSLQAAQFAADAIFRGADTAEKVKAYVTKRLTVAPVVAAPVVMVGVPVLETESVSIVHVEPVTPLEPVTVRGKRGRKKNGSSDFCKALDAIQTAPAGASRRTVLDCIIAKGIKESSAVVYYWDYHTNGRRD